MDGSTVKKQNTDLEKLENDLEDCENGLRECKASAICEFDLSGESTRARKHERGIGGWGWGAGSGAAPNALELALRLEKLELLLRRAVEVRVLRLLVKLARDREAAHALRPRGCTVRLGDGETRLWPQGFECGSISIVHQHRVTASCNSVV